MSQPGNQPIAVPLPQVLYVYRNDDGGEQHLVTEEDINNTAEVGKKRIVGRYTLVEAANVEIKTKVTPIG